MNTLAPKQIPAHFGPYRTAALLESQDGWCAICDELPIKEGRRSSGRRALYTCGRKACQREWSNLCGYDLKRSRKARAA